MTSYFAAPHGAQRIGLRQPCCRFPAASRAGTGPLKYAASSARRSLLALVTACFAFAPAHETFAVTWTSFAIDTFATSAFRATALAHLPDGRFAYGVAGQLFVQNSFGTASKTVVPVGALVLDPSFIAVRDGGSAIVGQGGYAATSNVYSFNPSLPASGVSTTPLAAPQNYAGVYWKHPVSLREGWLVGGSNGVFADNNVTFVSLDGTKVGAVTGSVSAFSGGIATDAAGNLYAATYDIDFNTFEPTPDANRVLKFTAAQVDAAVAAIIAGAPAPVPVWASTFMYQFDSTSNIAVDSLGRVWATGFSVNHLQVFDPATQSMSRIVPQHGSFPAGTDVLYTVRDFTRSGAGYVAFLAQDENGAAGTNVYTGYATTASIVIPPVDQWRALNFGVSTLALANESSLWGPHADPDRDGVPNLIEYASGTPPLGASVTPITTGVQGGSLRFSFVRDPLNTDLTYVVEVAGALTAGAWQEIAHSTGGASTISSGIGAAGVSEAPEGPRVRVTVTDPLTGTGRFARLRVILTPP
ncbi:MAG: hypothetical protein K1X78_22975 [Verrucomicrobiaceae bacterium]|nr:hypothetical protein [Verrucomicrobiaceae bacterium]